MATKKIEIVNLPAKKHYSLPDYTFGVEIECFNVSPDIVAWKLNEAGIKVNGYEIRQSVRAMLNLGNRDRRSYSSWDIGEDGSIRGRDSMEIRSPILRGEKGLKEIERVCGILRGLKAKVNDSCGLHVHVGVKNSKRKFNVAQIVKMMETYEDNSKKTDRWFRKGRRTGRSTYARSVKPLIEGIKKETKTITNWVYDNGYGHYVHRVVPNPLPKDLKELSQRGDHFDRVNVSAYREHGTIEFRQHHGSLDAGEITNWIRFLLNQLDNSRDAVALEKKLKKDAAKKPVLVKVPPLLGLPKPVQKHFENRVKKYRVAA